MANWTDPRTLEVPGSSVGGRDAAYDAGLRAYMLKIYNFMASGVLLTGIVAMLVANNDFASQLMQTPLRWLFILAPLAIVLTMSFGQNRFSAGALQVMFWLYAGLLGVSMSTIFLVYSGQSIATTFFTTAAAFVGLSLYGYTTKRDLSAMGTFLIMGLIGLIVASIINIFVGSTVFQTVISMIGVLIFAGLTAYDTQKLKDMYAYVEGSDMMGKVVIMGALNLYLDFINMFQFLLSFMGSND